MSSRFLVRVGIERIFFAALSATLTVPSLYFPPSMKIITTLNDNYGRALTNIPYRRKVRLLHGRVDLKPRLRTLPAASMLTHNFVRNSPYPWAVDQELRQICVPRSSSLVTFASLG